MSSERGNVNRHGPPKHANKMAFRNNLHDQTAKWKTINSLEITGLCEECTKIVEWKIRYKKFKLLTTAKTCVSCSRKAVLRSYNILCNDCAEKKKVCAKCVKKEIKEEIEEEKEEVSKSTKKAAKAKAAKEKSAKEESAKEEESFFDD